MAGKKEIALGVIAVMFDFKRQMTVVYKDGGEPEVIGEGMAAIFYFLVYTTPDRPYTRFTRYLTTGLHKDCKDEFAYELNETAVKAADDFMQRGGGLPVDVKKSNRPDRKPATSGFVIKGSHKKHSGSIYVCAVPSPNGAASQL